MPACNAYRLAQPKDLPAGTKIRCTAGWDNSVQNDELMQLFNDADNPNNFEPASIGAARGAKVSVAP